MVRNLLVNCGVKDIYEAADGIAALDTIRTVGPDVVILDWEMPLLSGAELVRIVRSPGVFPMPDVPIIMLSGYGERWRVVEAVRLGVNEYLVKPVSAKALYDRLVSIIMAAASGGATGRLLRSGAAQARQRDGRERRARRVAHRDRWPADVALRLGQAFVGLSRFALEKRAASSSRCGAYDRRIETRLRALDRSERSSAAAYRGADQAFRRHRRRRSTVTRHL